MSSDDAGDPPHGGGGGGGDHRDLPESLRQRIEALVPDLVRRTFTAGLGAVFSTEDSIRKMAKDLNVPNVAGYLGEAADNTKDKILEVVAREVREFLAHVNLSEEIARLLTTLSFEVKTEIRFIPNSERYTGVEPDVKAAVRVKRTDRDDEVKEPDKPAAGAHAPEARHSEERRSRLRRLWRRATEPVRDAVRDDDELAPDDEP